MIKSARLLVIVADHTKWGVVGLSSFARLDQADVLITDTGIDPAVRDQLAAAVGRLITVDALAATGSKPPPDGAGL